MEYWDQIWYWASVWLLRTGMLGMTQQTDAAKNECQQDYYIKVTKCISLGHQPPECFIKLFKDYKWIVWTYCALNMGSEPLFVLFFKLSCTIFQHLIYYVHNYWWTQSGYNTLCIMFNMKISVAIKMNVACTKQPKSTNMPAFK